VKWLLLALLFFGGPVAHAQQQNSYKPVPLTPFETTKAAALLQSKLPCLGCHTFKGTGGRIGPDLTDVNTRLTPQYIYSMIRDPQGTKPGSVMPRVPLDERTAELIANYLVRADHPLPPISPPALQPTTQVSGEGAALYARFCAPCHGAEGKGDGPNARYLPIRPTVHASAENMSRRPDDALFDAIFAGGYVMNRSSFMPPFGQTLSRDQIWSLVRQLRTLCHCTGPAWSTAHQ
jgi:mono/diheme cytochrome c family protein